MYAMVKSLGRSLRHISGLVVVLSVALGSCSPIDLESGLSIPSTTPVISRVIPDQGIKEGGTEVLILGDNFSAEMEVLFGDSRASRVELIDNKTLSAVTPAQPLGEVDVVVRNGQGDSAVLQKAYKFSETVTPSQGATTGGTKVTILGNNLFSSGVVVLFGTEAASDVEMLNHSVLTAVTPPHAAGAVDIVIQHSVGNEKVFEDAFEYVTSVPASGGPRLVSAVSTSNTTVVVTFSEAVGEGAVDPSNYSIVQANVNSESAVLLVLSATPSADRMTVLLETASQNEVTYELHVTNIRDLAGNPLAAPELLLDPTRVEFAGTPPVPADGIVDTDGDGLPDNEEQYGWHVIVELADGTVLHRTVTSDPGVADTDGDGLSDAEEMAIGSDPRDTDTDGDLIPDAEEWNEWYSSPTDQDSDDDTLIDSMELVFQTSPAIADTDGDQLNDAEEIIHRNRNPLLADLPLPQITVDEIRLDLKITSSYTNEQGVTTAISDATSTTFTQSRSEKTGTSTTNSTEMENTNSHKFGLEVAYGVGAKEGFGGKFTTEHSFGQRNTRGFSSMTSREQARASQEEHQRSVSKALITSEGRTVTRSIDEAIIQASVNIANQSDIAFTITNLEISVLQQDRWFSGGFRPIATMRPSGADNPLAQPSYNLGPFDPERGPIIFENVEIFPNLVDDLMREPTGLVFKVVNFDILDEFGRNFVFSSQEVNDRTVGITIDFGDGIVESYRAATNSKFDASGRAVGITMERALEIAGLTRVPGDDEPFTPPADPWEPLPPEIRKTYGTAVDDDGFERLTRIRGVQTDIVIVSEEPEKRFWTIITSNTDLPRDVDFSTIQVHAGEDYLLLFTRDIDKDHLFEREEYLYGSSDRSIDSDGDSLEDYFEVRTGWTVYKVPGMPYKTFPSPARFDSDLDNLTDDQEYTAGTDPNRTDTDEDALQDDAELAEELEIILFDGDADDFNNPRITITPYSSWAIIDGGNGTADTAAEGDDEQIVDVGNPVKVGDVVIGPGANGVLDTTPDGDDESSLAEEIVNNGPRGICDTTARDDDIQVVAVGADAGAYQVLIRAGLNGVIDTPPAGDDDIRVVHDGLFTTNPLNRDTDLDGIPDGREMLLGINPNIRDAGRVIDSDLDGLYDIEEDNGWDVTVWEDCVLPTMTEIHVTSNKYRADTDLDGLPDVYEWAIGSNPNAPDTDGDTLFDAMEFDPEDTDRYYSETALITTAYRCALADNCEAPSVLALDHRLRTHVCKMDTDCDKLDDNVEVYEPWVVRVVGKVPYEVYSKPYSADFDLDELKDRDELFGADGQQGGGDATDPNEADTDDDKINDNIEVDRGSNPLSKDKYVRFTFVHIKCTKADDEGTDDEIEVFGTWYIRKGSEYFEVRKLWDYGFDEGEILGLGNIYDFLIDETEPVVIGNVDVYENGDDVGDPESFNDAFETFTYDVATSGQVTLNNTCDDGDLETLVNVEVIVNVPSTRYCPVGPCP